MSPKFLKFYKELYACMHCSTAESERSVKPFVQPGPLQTLPVSHFGDISNAKIWLVATVPKGNRSDSNVGFRPTEFVSRTRLTCEQTEEAFDHFSGYFTRDGHDSFFDRWINILDGIEVAHQAQSFVGGGICCVDLIKCPTVDTWSGVLRGPDKQLIYHCFLNDESQRYLKRQVQLHHPKVLIFSAGLGGPIYYSNNCRMNRDVGLRALWPAAMKGICSGVWSFDSSTDQSPEEVTSAQPQRILSIGLKSDRDVELANTDQMKQAIQGVVRSWETK